MTIRSVKARTAARRTYMVLYALCVALPVWAWFAPPNEVEAWAGRFSMTVWTLLMVVGAVAGFVSAKIRYVQMERVAAGILAVGLLLFAFANLTYDGLDGLSGEGAMSSLVLILSVVVFVPIRWHQLDCGYYIEPRPERFEEQRE